MILVLERTHNNIYHREFAIRSDKAKDLPELDRLGFFKLHETFKIRDANDWLAEYMDTENLLEENQTII